MRYESNNTTKGKTMNRINVNDRIECGEVGTDDYDTGSVTSIENGQVTVAWDSLVATTQSIDLLKRI